MTASELHKLGIGDHGALDRLPARDSIIVRGIAFETPAVEIAEAVDRELRAVHQLLHHRGLADVVNEEFGGPLVIGAEDRAGAGTLSGLDDHGVVGHQLPRQDRWR